MKKAIILTCITVLFGNIALAGALGGFDAGAINNQQMEDLRWHEAITREKAKNDSFVKAKSTGETPQQVADGTIQKISFLNNAAIPASELQYAVNPYMGKPMTAENIAAIRKSVMTFYQKRGFFSAVAMVASQDTQTGELIIEVREGTRNSIAVE